MVRDADAKPIQLALRMTERDRKELEEAAERRGRSMNSEVLYRLQQAHLVDLLSSGVFDVGDLTLFRDYVLLVKAACRDAGVKETDWREYVPVVPLSLHPGAREAAAAAVEKLAREPAFRPVRRRSRGRPVAEFPDSFEI
jgi:hypothetical protein